MNQKIALVTGASGLTGQFVVEELLRRGHAVRVLRRTPAMSSSVEVDDRAVRHRRSVDIHRPVRRAPSVTRCYQHDHDTDSHARIRQAVARLDVGGLIVNDVPTFRVDNMPYGGVRDSGLGREGVRFAIEEMCEQKLIVYRDK